MSRIGRLPVPIPAGVTLAIDGTTVTVTGPKGKLTHTFDPKMTITVENGRIIIQRPNDEKYYRAQHGLTRALLANMVAGVSAGFTRQLELVGVGYRAQKQGTKLVLSLGYSHPIEVEAPAGITFNVEGTNKVVVAGADKQLVGQTAADIRRLRPPEPYNGKGVKYADEVIRRKAGKAGKAGGKGKK
ncbi:MAG: 50S ribosomal protein L6 [Dehalococcoidia bacterium]|nr:50S ribosomal protein L6 [Dehalococcoidia bacterium]